MSKKKKIILIILAAFLISIAIAWHFLGKRENDSQLTLYGNVDIRQVSLAFRGSDRIASLAAKEGDHVKTGDILGSLDTSDLELQIAYAEAQLEAKQQALLRLENGTRPEEIAQAKSTLNSAKAEADNATQQLYRLESANQETENQAVSQLDIDSAIARKKVAQANVVNAKKSLELALIGPREEDIAGARAEANALKAQLNLLKYNLAEAQLKAPINAIIRNRLLEPGDMASPQRPVFVLAISDPKWVRAYVAEADLSRIQSGMAASVTTDTHPDTPIPGRIGFISSVAEFTPKTVQTEELRTSLVYELRIFVDDPEDKLRLGMPATVNISLNHARREPAISP